MDNTKIIEKGMLYFFCRTKMDVDTPENLDDIARLHLVLIPDGAEKGRMFIVGKKRLPEILKGTSKSEAREWMMNVAVATPPELGEALGPIEYETKTRGMRHEKGAVPVGEAGYVIIRVDSHTELAYQLARPERRGNAQKELGILREAGFVISAKNPDVETSGFPDDAPDYPRNLRELFADERWIDVSDPKLLDYENAQFLLVGARDDLSGYDVNIPRAANLFDALDLDEADWPTQALEKGSFATEEPDVKAGEPETNRTKGGERGGKAAARSDSASGVATALKGIDLPKKRVGLVKYARGNDAPENVLELLASMPDRDFKTMADVQKALGEVR